jgi:hypothetical protein
MRIIIIIIISFMQGIDTYIPETNHVPKQYNVATIVVTVYGACITSSCVGSNVLLHKHFPKCVCSAQYGSFLLFLNFMVSWYQGRTLLMNNRGKANSCPPPHPPGHKNLKKKKNEALQYCDSNEFIELTVGTARVLMSQAATNNICSNKHKA